MMLDVTEARDLKRIASARREEQRRRYEGKIEHYRRLREGLDDCDERDEEAALAELERRDAKFRRRTALASIRELVCGSRRKEDCAKHPAGRIFEHILERWRRIDYDPQGVAIPLAELQAMGGYGRRKTFQLLDSLKPYLHIENRGCLTNRYRVMVDEYMDD